MMCLLAPYGFNAIRQLFPCDWRTALGLGVICVLPWLPIDARTQEDPAWCAHIDGNLALMESDLDAAERHYREAVRLDPDDWSAHVWLADTLAKRNQLSEALEHVQVVLSDFPDSFPTLRTAASLEARQGNYAESAELLLRAYGVPGDRTSTGLKAVRMLIRSGQNERASALLNQDAKLSKRWSNAQ